MKKIILVLLISTLLIGIGGSNAMAAWSLYIDNSDINDTSVTFDIWFNTDEDFTLTGYQLFFNFDTDELSYNSYTNTPPAGMFPSMFGAFTENGNELQFNAGGFANTTINSNTLLGSLTFGLLTGASQDGTSDLVFDTDNLLFGLSLASGQGGYMFSSAPDAASHLTYGEGLDVGSPVPVPGAAILLGSGLLGLIGIRRSKS